MIYYETTYTHKGVTRQYRTKSLTTVHERLRTDYPCSTLKCDTSVKWPFGVFGEVVATSLPRRAPVRLEAV